MKKKTRHLRRKSSSGAAVVKAGSARSRSTQSRLAKSSQDQSKPDKSKAAKSKAGKSRSSKSKAANPGSAKAGSSKKTAPAAKAGAATSRKKGGRVSKSAVPRGSKAATAQQRTVSAPDDNEPAIQRLRAQLAQAQVQIGELQASAETDFLLEIPNRRGFERELQRSISYIKRYQATAALIVLDVDRLKPINDAHGHAAGDQVLKAVVDALLDHVRASDVIGRLGGDEFALLLWNLSETDARAKAMLLEQTIDRLSIEWGSGVVSAGISAGVAMLGPDAEPGAALEQADQAMYLRKAQRRHAVK
jgi:diguanylate cyclase (GGDEF)-like protein